MKAIELNVPDEVYQKLETMASHDKQPVNVFAVKKIEELVRAFEMAGLRVIVILRSNP